MCLNDRCPLKTECGRSSASGTKPSEWQSYSYFKPEEVQEKSLPFTTHLPLTIEWSCKWTIPVAGSR